MLKASLMRRKSSAPGSRVGAGPKEFRRIQDVYGSIHRWSGAGRALYTLPLLKFIASTLRPPINFPRYLRLLSKQGNQNMVHTSFQGRPLLSSSEKANRDTMTTDESKSTQKIDSRIREKASKSMVIFYIWVLRVLRQGTNKIRRQTLPYSSSQA